MEQQNKLTEEEKAYQALRTQDMQDMLDLWSRIDTGFEEEVTKQTANQKKGRTRQLVLVAAAVLIVIIAVQSASARCGNQIQRKWRRRRI